MTIDPPIPWERFIGTTGTSTGPRLLAHPGGTEPSAWPRSRRGGEVFLAIGPEGGFTPEEVQTAEGQGWSTVGLGSTRLRVETAALAGVVLILGLCNTEAIEGGST